MAPLIWLPKNVRDAYKEREKQAPQTVATGVSGSVVIKRGPAEAIPAVAPAAVPQIEPKSPKPPKTEEPKSTPLSTKGIRPNERRLVVCDVLGENISCKLEDLEGKVTVFDCGLIELDYHSKIKADLTPKQYTFANVSAAELDASNRVLYMSGERLTASVIKQPKIRMKATSY